MESKYVIDSSVFVAFYYEGDDNHMIAKNILQTISLHSLIVHPYVISEVATVLAYKFSKKVADMFLRDILTSDTVQIPFVQIHQEVDFYISNNKKMSFTDMTLVTLAKKENANLITFDKQMITLYKK